MFNIKDFLDISIRNKEAIQKTDSNCSCYSCLETFPKTMVTEYFIENDCKETAICPHCFCDSVLPFEVPEGVLKEAQEYWFPKFSEQEH